MGGGDAGGRRARSRPSTAAASRSSARPGTTRWPAGDGVLPRQQRGCRGALRPGRARARARGDRGLGRPPRERHAGDLLGRRRRSSSSRCTSGRSTRAPAGPDEQDETTREHARFPPARATTDYLRAFDERRAGGARFEPELLLVSAGFDAHVATRWPRCGVTEAGFRELARRCAALAPRVAAVLEGGYDPRTCRGSWRPR